MELLLVRWDKVQRRVSELIPQLCSWGGFKSTLLSFVPLDSTWVEYWERECFKHHGVQMVPSLYSLELEMSYEDLIKEALKEYSEGSIVLKELGIQVTLEEVGRGKYQVVELRIYSPTTLELLKDEG